MKKRILAFLPVLMLLTLASCGSDTATTISPKEYDAMNAEILEPLLVSGILYDSWQDANALEPGDFVSYYASALLASGEETVADENGFIPAEALEAMVRSRFDVTAERLRENEDYDPELLAYAFGGLGSVRETEIAYAEQDGKTMTIGYSVLGPMGYTESTGAVKLDVTGALSEGSYRYLSNETANTTQFYLDYPNGTGQVDRFGVLMLNSGGGSSTRTDANGNPREYGGEDLASVIAFYEEEALPSLAAEGEADAARYADGWFWSGTYGEGTPLVIDVQRKFASAQYVIAAVYGEEGSVEIADAMRSDFMEAPSLDELYELGGLLRPLLQAGLLDRDWLNIDVNLTPKTPARTEGVSVTSVTSYGRGENDGLRLAVSYALTGGKAQSGVVELVLSSGGQRYISHTLGDGEPPESPTAPTNPNDEEDPFEPYDNGDEEDPAEAGNYDYGDDEPTTGRKYYTNLSPDDEFLYVILEDDRGLTEEQIHTLGNLGLTFREMVELTDEEISEMLAPGSRVTGDTMNAEEIRRLVTSGIKHEDVQILMSLGYDYPSAAALTDEQLDFILPNTELIDHLVAAGYDREMVRSAANLSRIGGYDSYKELLDEIFA